MKTPNIKSTQQIIPMIYAYSTPEVERHDGWSKIGYTEKQTVENRIKQQSHTVGVKTVELWKGMAIYDDGSGESFTDTDFHAYLQKCGIIREKATEWFHVDGPTSKSMFHDFKENRGQIESTDTVISYQLRSEQEAAVQQTIDYRKTHAAGNPEFLWNAKPRFGKTLSVYDFAKRINATNILIVTNRPAIANSWYEDYIKFLGKDSGYLFVSEVHGLKGKPGVLSRKEYIEIAAHDLNVNNCIEFVSLQNLKGSSHFGGTIDKLEYIKEINWDILVIDEAHEGVDTLKTDIAFDYINRKFTIHLSGTPFKALANEKFSSDQIFNWTYADEQRMKHNWDEETMEPNPYATLPQLNMFTYKMSDIVEEQLKHPVSDEFDNYAFDLNEFFSVKNGKFAHEESVDRFLDALTTQKKFPFSTPELRNELKHTLWLLNRVDSARALARKLQTHPVFQEYEIVLAAGDGKIDEEDIAEDSYKKTKHAIENNDKTITISVGQLTTGITVPEWTGVLMLSNIQSPSLYMQAAFRAQNPCLFRSGTLYLRKENAYVFDFDPARTLTVIEHYANDLYSDTVSGQGDLDTRKKRIRELLNFFPVIGEDEDGELIELDAERVLSVPRKIRCQEVVKRGFMSNFLFQNIDRIFGAPKEVFDIINTFEPVNAPKAAPEISGEAANDIEVDENGNVVVSQDKSIGLFPELFGKKIYDEQCEAEEALNSIDNPSNKDGNEELKKYLATKNKAQVETVTNSPNSGLTAKEASRIEAGLNRDAARLAEKLAAKHRIEQSAAEKERDEALKNRFETGKSTSEIENEHKKKMKDLKKKQNEETVQSAAEFTEQSKLKIAETVEKNKQEKIKESMEDNIRDRLRGFARTIPSFLMAYGDENTTLETFDQIVPDSVFQEVTRNMRTGRCISLDQFRFLRDGGDYIDAETGETKHFSGQLFDPVVFNDSVKEFLNKKKQLANYFDESQKEDIFDYIPPQQTNQIFTPKNIVKKMVDMLEENNPGCFDDPYKTYIDLYMKSGLYIAEIVKRLYNNEVMKNEIPDDQDRLRWIFEEQVYGLAPTEIIYRIAVNFVLGFSDTISIPKHNLKLADTLPAAKNGTLPELLDKLFP